MVEENIVRIPGVPFDPVKKDWEDDIVDAYRDAPRKAVWVPMDSKASAWYISRERGIHDLVNAVLREYVENETARRKSEGQSYRE